MQDREDAIDDLFQRPAAITGRRAPSNHEELLAQARASLQENSRDPATYIAAARRCKEFGRLYEALDILAQGIGRCEPSPALHEYYIERLEKCNRTEDAIAMAHDAARRFPGDLIFRLREALLLPVL